MNYIEITALVIMVLTSGKIVHNLIRIERIHKRIKIMIEINNEILN